MNAKGIFFTLFALGAIVLITIAGVLTLWSLDPVGRLTRAMNGSSSISSIPLSRQAYISATAEIRAEYATLIASNTDALNTLPKASEEAAGVAKRLIAIARKLDALVAASDAVTEEAAVNIAVANLVACSRNITLSMQRESKTAAGMAAYACEQARKALEYAASPVPSTPRP